MKIFGLRFMLGCPGQDIVFPLSPSLTIHGNYIAFTSSYVFNCYFYELLNLNLKFFDKNVENIKIILPFMASL